MEPGRWKSIPTRSITGDEPDFTRVELERLLATLPKTDRELVEMVFGWEDGKPKSKKQVGQMLGVSHQRIAQKVKRSLAKMRRKAE